jgi:hypothetical protein
MGAWEINVRAPRAMSRSFRAVLSEVSIAEGRLPPLDIVVSDAGDARGIIGGEESWRLTLPKRGWLALLVGHTVGAITSLLQDLLFVHAGAVAWRGRGYVVIGAPGAGKTAAAAVLVRNGAAYLSDEVALLEAKTGLLHPFALPLAVKPWTAKAIGLLPPVRFVASEGGVRYLLPSGRTPDPVLLDTLILLDPNRVTTDVAELSRAELLLTLSQHPSSFRYRSRLESAFTGFVTLMRGARCLHVGAAVPSQAATAIASLIGLLR